MEVKYQQFLNQALDVLPSRKREIVERRFGISTGKMETLQSIGNDFGITRERVRQIINDSLNHIRETKMNELVAPLQYLSDYLKQRGHLKREDILLQETGGDKFQNYVYFFLNLGEDFQRYKEDEDLYTVWTIKEEAVFQAKTIIKTIVRHLDKKRQTLPLEEVKKTIDIKIHTQALYSYIEASKHIEQSPEGLFGLVHWPEINPRSIRDKAYVVLKKKGEPMHFREIALEINKIFDSGKSVAPESVHNELIRSPHFVLIGRGIYALTEWGYQPGTVKDVIVKILEKEQPLSREEIVQKVLQQRKVKENTIFLNLQDKDLFVRDELGRYLLREKSYSQ